MPHRVQMMLAIKRPRKVQRRQSPRSRRLGTGTAKASFGSVAHGISLAVLLGVGHAENRHVLLKAFHESSDAWTVVEVETSLELSQYSDAAVFEPAVGVRVDVPIVIHVCWIAVVWQSPDLIPARNRGHTDCNDVLLADKPALQVDGSAQDNL